MSREPMALSVQQPWAWLIVNGHKGVENREWSTKFRGPLLIHAGKKFDREGYEWVLAAFPAIPLPEPGQYDLGGVVGRVRLVDCVSFGGPVPEKDEDWFFGAYGLVLTDARPELFRPVRGQLGFFDTGLLPVAPDAGKGHG